MRVLTDEQLHQVAEKLRMVTEKRGVTWTVSDSSDTWFYTTGENGYSYVIASRDKDDRHPYDFRIYQDETILVDMGSDLAELSNATVMALERLYGAAKAQALSADELFEGVMATLEEIERMNTEPF